MSRDPAQTFEYFARATIGAGLALVAGLAFADAGIPLGDWRLFLFAALVLLGELLPIDVPRREGFDRVTVSTAFALAILLLFGVFEAVLAYALASAAADAVARLRPLKLLFNAAQYALAMGAAGAVMALLGLTLPIDSMGEALPATLAAAAAFFVVNHVLAGVAAALLQRERLPRYLLADFGFQVLTAGFVLALAPVVVACSEVSMALVPLCLLPVLAVYVGARQAARDAHRAVHDALTGLPNRVMLTQRLNRALARAAECDGTVALMIVDLDDFKAVNDTMGHAYGDRLLQAVGQRMQAALTPEDTLARLGGDEFAVLPAAPMSEREARTLAARLVDALDDVFSLDGIALHVRASVGVAIYPQHGDASGELLRHADVALYCAKEAQSPVALYAAAHDHYTVDRLMLASQLRRGIADGEIVLEYQPKHPLRGGRPRGVEALARWEHPTLGRISPDGFIPLAERTGLVHALTAVVLREALVQCARWRDGGLTLRVSVNVSPRSLAEPELPALIRAILDELGLSPELLQLEVTESSPLPSGRGATAVLEELRAMGIGVAIDDFGTGFSSLVQLQRLPVDEIKIDRSFVTNMHDAASAAIVRSTIDLARNLGLSVTAEGVETEDVRRQLAAMGCELAQGYHLCRPEPAHRCAEAIRATPPRLEAVSA